MEINKGEVFLLSTGQWSDYSVIAVCEALEDIETEEVKKRYLEVAIKDKKNWIINPGLAYWLINIEKLAKEIIAKELHYEDFNIIELDIKGIGDNIEKT